MEPCVLLIFIFDFVLSNFVPEKGKSMTNEYYFDDKFEQIDCIFHIFFIAEIEKKAIEDRNYFLNFDENKTKKIFLKIRY